MYSPRSVRVAASPFVISVYQKGRQSLLPLCERMGEGAPGATLRHLHKSYYLYQAGPSLPIYTESKVMLQQYLPSFKAVALLCLLTVATADVSIIPQSVIDSDQELGIIVGGSAGSRSRSRLMRPRRRMEQISSKGHRRELFEDLELEDGKGQSPCRSIIAVGGTRRLRSLNEDATSSTSRHLNSNGIGNDEETIEITYHEEGEHESDEEFLCELNDGNTVPIQGTEEQMMEMRTLLNNGMLISAKSTVEVEYGSSSNGGDSISGYDEDTTIEDNIVSLPPGSIKIMNRNTASNSDTVRRRLNKHEGVKKALVVRVTDLDGKAPDQDASFLSDKVFGSMGDSVTMASGFEACSFGKLQFTTEYGDDIDTSPLSAPGVLDVRADIRLETSSQATVRSAVLTAAQDKMGFAFPGPFDHVLFVVEKCYMVAGETCSFAAYAFINHWFSIYVEDNYKFPAVSMHEIGHNLNLAHSGGKDGRTYTDHTCLMGNPLWEDNVGAMCFNPVKNFQIARGAGSWYQARHIKTFNSGTEGRKSWRGKLVGVAEYDNNPDNHAIVVKLETGTDSDWFFGFNRAIKANADTVQAKDQVTIYKVQEGDGLGYSHSFLKGTLSNGQKARISDWRRSGSALVVTVHEINTSSSPGFADVEFTFEGKLQPTAMPTDPAGPDTLVTSSPIDTPTPEPTLEPTPAPTISPTNQPSNSPSNKPKNVPSVNSIPVPLDSTTAISFDDLTSAGYLEVTSIYNGLNWKDFYVLHHGYFRNSGYDRGVVSGRYVAFYTGGNSLMRTGSISSMSPFSVAGFQATAAWLTGVKVLVESFGRTGNRMDSYQTTLGDPSNGPIFVDLRGGNFQDLYELRITSSGGSPVGMSGDGPYLAIDDFRIYNIQSAGA